MFQACDTPIQGQDPHIKLCFRWEEAEQEVDCLAGCGLSQAEEGLQQSFVCPIDARHLRLVQGEGLQSVQESRQNVSGDYLPRSTRG